MTEDVDQLAVNTIRALSMDAVEAAQSGHPGTPMALAPVAQVLWRRHLRHNPGDPQWADRDRFVLSCGHASMLLYSLLHLTGYDLSLDDIKDFRQLGSATPGHPEDFETPGVETTTGPLGQGVGNAVGMALAEAILAERFNRAGHSVIDHRTWVMASDGDLMEGVSGEASSLAGHLGLGKLVVLYDDNRITIDGSTELAFSEDVEARYAAYGWRTLSLEDVNDLDEVDKVLSAAAESDGRPTLVRLRTVIGYPSPNAQDTAAAHGSPLGADEVAGAKEVMGWSHPAFFVPQEVARAMDATERGAQAQAEWDKRFDAYREAHPELADELQRVLDGDLPSGWDAGLPTFEVGSKLATRSASGKVINALAARIPELLGGSADLAGSNKTTIEDGGDVARGAYDARNVNYGVREHAMGALMNGLVLHGGVRPFGGSFLIFTDYLRPALRLACLMGLPVIYVMTHDSIGLGEDGPTHQPVEHLAALRAIPGLVLLRPADATETVGAWVQALQRDDGPTVLALSRQDLPTLAGSDASKVALGAYTVLEPDDEPDVILLATGSEVSIAVQAAERLGERAVAARVVSMPSWELLEEADEDYVEELLPEDVPVLSIEAATSFGWARWADEHVSLESFGASAPVEDLYVHFGFTPENVADIALELLEE